MNNSIATETPKEIAAAVILGVGAISGYMGLPYLVGLLTDKLALQEHQSGLLVSADMIGIAIVSLLTPWWLNRFQWRFVTPLALLIIIICSVLTVFVETFTVLMTIRIIAGLAGGVIFTQGMVFLASGKNPERNIGLFSAGAATWMTLTMLIMPRLAESFNTNVALAFLVVIPLLCSFCLFWWPGNYHPKYEKQDGLGISMWHKPVMLGLLCFIFFTANIGIIWGFIERIGVEYQLPTVQLGQAIALANFISIGGGLIAAWIGNRWGHFKPLAIALSIQACCLLLLAYSETMMNIYIFTAILSVYFLFWNFIDVFQISVLIDIEPSGRSVGLVPAFTAIGNAIGPLLATFLIMGKGFANVSIVAAVLCIITIAVYAYLLKANSKTKI